MNNYQLSSTNNLRIITVPIESTRTVTVLVMVGTGSKYEQKEQNGLSHLLEHMFFKGTENRPSTLEIASTLDKVGGDYNAFTSKETTGFWAKVDFKHLDLALDWTSDIILNSKFEAEKLEREKGVILEELSMYLDTPIKYIEDLWEKLLYGDQPAGWLTIGTRESISSFDREQLLEYFHNHYLAQNSVVCVAGNIDSAQTRTQIEDYFGKFQSGQPEDKPEVVEQQDQPQISTHHKETDQTHLALGVRGYDLFDSRRYVQSILATVLGGNMSSRLFTEIRGKRGLCYYINSTSETKTDSGYLVTRAGVDHDNVKQTVDLILKEYRNLKEEEILEEELQKAKDYLKGNLTLNLESSEAQASFYGVQELLTKKILTPEEKFEKIDQVDRQDLKEVAQQLFQPENLNLALIGPHEEKDKFKPLKL